LSVNPENSILDVSCQQTLTIALKKRMNNCEYINI